jgi:uncharacterized protein involved in outer membrane biogenesis
MKTFVKVILILFLIVAVLVGIVLGGIEWYLHSDSFKQMVRTGLRDSRGFQLDDFDVSLFRGVTLKGLTITNGVSATAGSLTVRHRILPLFQKRAELAEISLDRPVFSLPLFAGLVAANNTNRFDMPPELRRSGWQFVLDKFAIRNGDISFLDAANKPVLRFRDFNLDVSPPQSSGALRATVASGSLTGSLALRQPRWQLQLDLRDADVPEMFRQAGLPPLLKGKLQTTAALEGGDSLTGRGRVQIIGGTAAGMPLMNLLASLLQTPALRELQLDEGRMEFTIATNRMHTPVIRMIAKQIELTGRGVVSLEDGSLNHDLTLVLSQEVADRAPGAIRRRFTEQTNGRCALGFHLTGTYAAPKVDIEDR